MLLRSIREAQSALAAMSSPTPQETVYGESLDRFLARLPSLWQPGEARPTHKARIRPPRHWRTRKDPFEGAWCDVLLWLEKDPDTTAKDLLAKLRQAHPGRFGHRRADRPETASPSQSPAMPLQKAPIKPAAESWILRNFLASFANHTPRTGPVIAESQESGYGCVFAPHRKSRLCRNKESLQASR